MGTIASKITSLTSIYSTIYWDTDQRKQQSSASLVFVWGIHRGPVRGPVNSPHKWPVTRKMFPFDDVIMECCMLYYTDMCSSLVKDEIACYIDHICPMLSAYITNHCGHDMCVYDTMIRMYIYMKYVIYVIYEIGKYLPFVTVRLNKPHSQATIQNAATLIIILNNQWKRVDKADIKIR